MMHKIYQVLIKKFIVKLNIEEIKNLKQKYNICKQKNLKIFNNLKILFKKKYKIIIQIQFNKVLGQVFQKLIL